jgi:RHS repeat-associated protein
LTKDVDANINAGGFTWTADGKLRSVTNTKPATFTFSYDAMRNRVVKRVQQSSTDIYTYYIRDAQGNIMATYERSGTTLTWKEAHLYGTERLGLQVTELQVRPRPVSNPNQTTTSSQEQLKEGWKRYELNNHLGNVLAVITDRKFNKESGTPNGLTDFYDPEVIAAQDYYAFGMIMPQRSYQNGTAEYRFGFNGQEEDNEIKGNGNQLDFKYRAYDPRVGRFFAVDPFTYLYFMNFCLPTVFPFFKI